MTILITLFGRLSIQSDPVVQFYDPVAECSVCGDYGHSQASCHYTKALDMSNMSHEDIVFWSYVHPLDRPQSLREEGDYDEEAGTDSQGSGLFGSVEEMDGSGELREASDHGTEVETGSDMEQGSDADMAEESEPEPDNDMAEESESDANMDEAEEDSSEEEIEADCSVESETDFEEDSDDYL